MQACSVIHCHIKEVHRQPPCPFSQQSTLSRQKRISALIRDLCTGSEETVWITVKVTLNTSEDLTGTDFSPYSVQSVEGSRSFEDCKIRFKGNSENSGNRLCRDPYFPMLLDHRRYLKLRLWPQSRSIQGVCKETWEGARDATRRKVDLDKDGPCSLTYPFWP